MVGNNTPIFFIRDPIKFPDHIHSNKKHPQNNVKDVNMMWDFRSYTPEILHNVTLLYSDRGIPASYRHMDGFSTHTFKWINDKGEVTYVKYHFKSDLGNKTLPFEEAVKLSGTDVDYHSKDLFDAIQRHEFPTWTWYVQLIPEKEGLAYKWDIFDATKVIPHGDYPLIPLGKITLNRNPDNFFAETEQIALSPSTLVPGIEPSMDKLL